jgi:hypothetical protein
MEKKPSPDFSDEGSFSTQSGCYFLQQPMLQHSLPLQQPGFDVVAAVAVLTKAITLRIKRRYFIISPV